MARKMICKLAKQFWKKSDRLEDDAYIFKDGTIIYMRYAKTNEIADHGHISIPEAWSDNPKFTEESVNEFLDTCGTIRYDIFESGEKGEEGIFLDTFETIKKPTDKQINVIAKHIQENRPKRVDFNRQMLIQSKASYCNYYSKNPRPLDVQRWVNKCWR